MDVSRECGGLCFQSQAWNCFPILQSSICLCLFDNKICNWSCGISDDSEINI